MATESHAPDSTTCQATVSMTAAASSDVLERVRQSRAAQGLPPGVRDPQILLGLRRILSGVGPTAARQ